MGRRTWTFTDAVVVTASGTLTFGNHQAHKQIAWNGGAPRRGSPAWGVSVSAIRGMTRLSREGRRRKHIVNS